MFPKNTSSAANFQPVLETIQTEQNNSLMGKLLGLDDVLSHLVSIHFISSHLV